MIAVGATTLVAFVFERGRRGQAGRRIDNVTTTIFRRPTENLEVRVYRTLVYRATEVDGGRVHLEEREVYLRLP